MPKLHEKAIIRLEPDEVAIMLDNIENYEIFNAINQYLKMASHLLGHN